MAATDDALAKIVPEEATQQTAPDHQIPYGEPSFSSSDDGLGYLIGSSGISCTWTLSPTKHDLTWVVGRGLNADFRLPTTSKRLSSAHFRVWATRDDPPTIMIRDTSTNGTFLNSVRMPKDRNFMLVNGDIITVGLGVLADEIKLVVSIPKTSKATPQGGVYEQYDFGEVIGQGAFALVRQAVKRENGEKVAVKIIDKAKLTGSVQNSVEREIEILKKFRHPHIVALHDIYVTDKHYFLVMDYVPHGDLMDFLLNTQNSQQPGLSENTCREIVKQVLEAIHYVHEMGVSHRDLKPDNILIESLDPIRVKVGDFGLAKLQAQGTFLKTFCGTLSYLAPEVLASRNSTNLSPAVANLSPAVANLSPAVANSSPRKPGTGRSLQVYTHLVDIWSVGCLAYVILTGCMPFGGATQDDLFKMVISGNYHKEPLELAQVSCEGQHFIRTLLDTNTETRPQAVEALQHPWFHTNQTSSPVSSSLRNNSLSSLRDSQPTAHLRSSIPGMAHLGLQSSLPMPSVNANAASLANHEDSELDPEDVRHQIDLINSQSRASLSQCEGARDVENLASTGSENIPLGAWGELCTLQTSSPCKELFLTKNTFTIGRYTRGPPFDSELLDYAHPDARLSRRHCRVVRRFCDRQFEVWLEAFNTIYVNRVTLKPGTSIRVYDGDRVCLFAHEIQPGRFERLIFQLKLLTELPKYLHNGKRPASEVADPAMGTVELPATAQTSVVNTLNHGKREHSGDVPVPVPKKLHTVYE